MMCEHRSLDEGQNGNNANRERLWPVARRRILPTASSMCSTRSGRKPLRQIVADPGPVAGNSRFRFAPHRERLVEPSELLVDPYQYRRELRLPVVGRPTQRAEDSKSEVRSRAPPPKEFTRVARKKFLAITVRCRTSWLADLQRRSIHNFVPHRSNQDNNHGNPQRSVGRSQPNSSRP